MKIKRSRPGEYLMIIIGLIIGLPILILTIIIAPSNLKKQIETIGTVTHIGVYYHNEHSNHTTYTISAIYDCGSKKGIEGDSIGSTKQYYEIGKKITLYCDENEPGKFILIKPLVHFVGLLSGGLMFSMPWLIMSLIGIIRVKRQKNRKILKNFNTKVEATIIAINQCKIKIKNLFGRKFVIAKGIERFDEKLGFRIIAKHGENYLKVKIFMQIFIMHWIFEIK